MDGRKCNTTIKTEGADKLVQTQLDQKTGAVQSIITREIVGDELVQVIITLSYVILKLFILIYYFIKDFDCW